jgi:hypothetical protein
MVYRYFGFVTGGSLPVAQVSMITLDFLTSSLIGVFKCGDILATLYDQNVMVHLPVSSPLSHPYRHEPVSRTTLSPPLWNSEHLS